MALITWFSSPIGAFIFLIVTAGRQKYCSEKWFSSPIGAFIFLIKMET